MKPYFEIHPVSPQQRVLQFAINHLQKDGVLLYPTDTSYGFGCSINSASGVEHIVKVKGIEEDHPFSLITKDISQIAQYCKVDDRVHRILKRCLPGPFTFILEARREVPKKILPKRKTVGVRIPDLLCCQMLVESLGCPLLSSTAQFKDQEVIYNPKDFKQVLLKNDICVLDMGPLPTHVSTVVDLSQDKIEILREGEGDLSLLGL